MAVDNRRTSRRFHLELAAAVRRAGSDPTRSPCLLITRDISSAGAYFRSPTPFASGDQLDIGFSVGPRGINGLANVDVTGTVLRCEPDGMAVAFAEDYSITALVPPQGA